MYRDKEPHIACDLRDRFVWPNAGGELTTLDMTPSTALANALMQCATEDRPKNPASTAHDMATQTDQPLD